VHKKPLQGAAVNFRNRQLISGRNNGLNKKSMLERREKESNKCPLRRSACEEKPALLKTLKTDQKQVQEI